MIEHIVISSGGPHILVQLGMIAEAIDQQVIQLQNITSVHGCSSGSILGVFLCLRIPIQDVVDYVITRKWEKCVHYDIHQFYKTKGILDIQWIAESVIPFFKAYDVPLTITMEEFYVRTGIEFDILTTEVSEMKSILINHTTYPELPVLTAIQMSSAIPIIFPPVQYKEKYYVDGVCRRHCPWVDFPEDSVCIFLIDSTTGMVPQLEDVTGYFQHLLMASYRVISESESIPKGRIFLCTDIPSVLSTESWQKAIQEESYRKMMVEVGRTDVKKLITE
jgi:predicted acylesterase/phospholipase RssA